VVAVAGTVTNLHMLAAVGSERGTGLPEISSRPPAAAVSSCFFLGSLAASGTAEGTHGPARRICAHYAAHHGTNLLLPKPDSQSP
jgi:hypothetical protein